MKNLLIHCWESPSAQLARVTLALWIMFAMAIYLPVHAFIQ